MSPEYKFLPDNSLNSPSVQREKHPLKDTFTIAGAAVGGIVGLQYGQAMTLDGLYRRREGLKIIARWFVIGSLMGTVSGRELGRNVVKGK